ncbi:MAG: helix-turn-helix domain-containing protein [Anaerolineae bacterium]|nr:helix-turn-helix domain-containing protein [Anaerolineae bacterium]
MDFGSQIRELRRSKKLTQRDLADLLEVDFTYVSKIENNKVDHPPSEELIRKMALQLDADPETLLDLAGKFDQDALKKTVADIPEVGVLLRRLQSGSLTPHQVRKMLDIAKDETSE